MKIDEPTIPAGMQLLCAYHQQSKIEGKDQRASGLMVKRMLLRLPLAEQQRFLAWRGEEA
jgi:hypothetical protein